MKVGARLVVGGMDIYDLMLEEVRGGMAGLPKPGETALTAEVAHVGLRSTVLWTCAAIFLSNMVS
jgi:hypothetical protein